LPFGAAFALQFFLPLPFALFGTYRFGRALGLRAWSAALAGAVYSLSGYFLSMTEFTFSSLAAAALPYVAWGAVRRRAGVLGVSMALLLLAGDPVLVYLALGTALTLAWRRAPVRSQLVLVGALAWAACAAAIQWLPTALLYFESSRSVGTVHGSTFWAMGTEQLLGLIVPRDREGPGHLLGSTYLGVITLGFALVGAASPRKKRIGLLVIAVLSLGLAVGDLVPLWRTFSQLVPGWSAFRFPAKAIAPFVLVVAVLAGRGAQRVLRGRRWAPVLVDHRAVARARHCFVTSLREKGVSEGRLRTASNSHGAEGAPRHDARQLATLALEWRGAAASINAYVLASRSTESSPYEQGRGCRRSRRERAHRRGGREGHPRGASRVPPPAWRGDAPARAS
jgi:hypothetical protein